jgi:non-ribosomal peptide synthetase component E (peptide arylation enzyme)
MTIFLNCLPLSSKVPEHVKYPEVPLFDMIDRADREIPDNTAIYFLGKKINYRDLKTMVDKIKASGANVVFLSKKASTIWLNIS